MDDLRISKFQETSIWCLVIPMFCCQSHYFKKKTFPQEKALFEDTVPHEKSEFGDIYSLVNVNKKL